MSGGKGGQSETTQTVKLDPYLEGVAKENLALADKIGQLGYVPYSGPTVAGFSQPQVSAMRNTDSAANAFGLAGNSVVMDPNTGQPTSVGGMSMGQQVPGSGGYGYSAMPMYEQALANMPQGQADFIKQFFINPQSGAAPTFDFASLRPPPASPVQQFFGGGGGGDGGDGGGIPWIDGTPQKNYNASSFLGGLANSAINMPGILGMGARALTGALYGDGNPVGKGALVSSKAPPPRPASIK
jgi:hypothetical protein